MNQGTDENSSLTSISLGASIFIIGHICYNLSEFIINYVLSRGLGTDMYGIYAFGITLVSISLIFTNVGSNKSLMKFIPQHKGKKFQRDIYTTISFVTSGIGCTAVVGFLIINSSTINSFTLDNQVLLKLIPLFSIILISETFMKVISGFFRGLEKAAPDILFNRILKPLLRLVAVVVGYIFYSNLYSILLLISISGLAVLFISVAYIIYVEGYSPKFGSSLEFKSYYSFSIPITFKDMASHLYSRVDILMIGFFLSSSAVGIYNIPVLISGLVTVPLLAFNHLFPSIASGLYSADDMDEFTRIYSSITRWSFIISLIISLNLIVFRQEILGLFGAEYTRGANILVLLIIGQLVNSAVGPSGYVLMMTNHQYLIVMNQWIFACINIILNYIFISKYGMIGAALGTIITLISLNSLRVGQTWYYERLQPYTISFGKPVISVIPAFLIATFLKLYLTGVILLVVGGITTSIVFLGVMALLGLEKEERSVIKNIYDSLL